MEQLIRYARVSTDNLNLDLQFNTLHRAGIADGCQYSVTASCKDAERSIKDDPNDWCSEHNDRAYMLNLVKRVIRVSMEANQIVDSLPLFIKDKS